MDTITIGILLPSSTILPVPKDFEKGLKDALKPFADTLTVELVKEFIGQGDIKMTTKACDKLLGFDEADIVTGIVSARAAGEVTEKFLTNKTTLLINDLGGTIPDPRKFNSYTFINSPQLWQHAYALGYWGVKTFGKKGMFLGAVYDAGYSFSQMFYEGMMAADPTAEWSFSVPPMPVAGQLTNMEIIMPFLEQYQPDFVFGAFCGAETTLFLNAMIANGWHRKTVITGLPYLIEPIGPLTDDVTVYTTLPFGDDPELSPAKAFYHMGFQSGNAIAKAAGTATTKAELKDEMAKMNAFFNIEYTTPANVPVAIVKNEFRAGQTIFNSTNIAMEEAYGLEIEKLNKLTELPAAGWFNPYLCI